MALKDFLISDEKFPVPHPSESSDEMKMKSNTHTTVTRVDDDTQLPHFSLESGDVKPRNFYQHSLYTLITEWWFLELLSWIVSAACLGAIILVLWSYDGKPLPDLGFGLTINGFISVFSGFAKSALIFPTAEALGQLKWTWFRSEPRSLLDFDVLDSASRGPWGAVVLLAQSILPLNAGARRMTLACLGAVVITVALPFDLFIQQLVQTPTVWFPINQTANVPRTTNYSTFNLVAKKVNTTVINPDISLQNNIVPMFYGAGGSMPSIQAICPTSQCEWSTFQTLGVTSACKPLPSEYLTLGCFQSPADWLNEVVLAQSPKLAHYPNITTCGYFLNATSDSRILMAGYEVGADTETPGEALNMRLFPLVDGITRQPYYDGSIMFRDVGDTISDFLFVATPGGTDQVYKNATPIAQECILKWSVQTMNSSFQSGHFHETVLDTWQNTTVGSFPWNVTYNATTGAPVGFQYSRPTVLNPPGSNVTFGLSQDVEVGTSFVMDIVLPSFLTAANATATPQYKFNSQGGNPQSLNMGTNPWFSTDNVPDFVADVAQAMTVTIRNSQNSSRLVEYFEGVALDSESRIQVLWAWLTLPLFLLACSLVFLLATIYNSERADDEVGVWKSSSLPILFTTLDGEATSDNMKVWNVGHLKRKAGGIRVKLGHDEVG